MKNRLLNHKITTFLKMKENEIPELKSKSIDEMIKDLISEDRSARVF